MSKSQTDNNGFEIKEGYVTLKTSFIRYYPPLCFFANKIINDRTAAEDIVEDVFVRLWAKEKDFANYRNIKAVLYISVKNACIDHLRKCRRINREQDRLKYLMENDTETFALNEIIRAELISEIHNEIQKLPVGCRNVMQLLFVEGWDTRKIASHLNISVGTVKTHKARGIQALRKKLGISTILLFSLFS